MITIKDLKEQQKENKKKQAQKKIEELSKMELVTEIMTAIGFEFQPENLKK